MKKVKGFICILRAGEYQEIMFGRNTGGGTGCCENFETNGLVPFDTISESQAGRRELQGRFFEYGKKVVDIAHIEMLIAESREECYQLRKRKSLIVVAKYEGISKLRGRVSPDATYDAVPGEDLITNGFLTFPKFDRALHVAQEVNRQGASPAAIATFKLKRLTD